MRGRWELESGHFSQRPTCSAVVTTVRLRSAGWEAPASYDLVAMAGSVDQLGAGGQWVGVDDHVALRVNSIRLVGSRCE